MLHGIFRSRLASKFRECLCRPSGPDREAQARKRAGELPVFPDRELWGSSYCCPAPSHQGLLEPNCPETGTAGSEGAARQRAAATRRNGRSKSGLKIVSSQGSNEGVGSGLGGQVPEKGGRLGAGPGRRQSESSD
jgi:hypothetical protein